MPIMLKLTAPRGKAPRRGIDHYWSVIMGREMQDMTFTVSEILDVSDADRSDVRDFVKRLHKAGLIQQTDMRPNGETVFKAVVRQSATPKVRRDGTVIEGASKQKAIWNAIRNAAFLRGFTAQDLVGHSSTDTVTLERSAVQTYIQMLAKAGYLIQLDKGGPGRLSIWRLDPGMNTGPLPPIILRTKVVFDQNRHQVIGDLVQAEEIDP